MNSVNKEVRSPGNLRRAVVLMATVLGACGPVDEGSSGAGDATAGTVKQEALAGLTLGLVAGNIRTANPQPLSTHADQIYCEFNQLGAQWVRIDANQLDTGTPVYEAIVQKAHAKNIKVNVVVPARYCGSDTDDAAIELFANAYKTQLAALANGLFTGTAKADAYEIGNEPNVTEAACPDGVSRYRVSPKAFAALLRKVWQWKTDNGRTELIISGGMRNTYLTEPYWTPFFNALAAPPNGVPKYRPFDYFGIHPYNPNNLDVQCINTGSSACFGTWKANLTSGLKSVAARVNTATGKTDSKLFATEFGLQLAEPVVSPAITLCGPNNCVLNQQQMAAGMDAAANALVSSGVTPFGLWYNYRDDSVERFGLRGVWNGNTYLPKTQVWNKYRNLAGGSTNTDPDVCWSLGATYFSLDFDTKDSRRTTVTYEWFLDHYKAECAPGERLLGLSRATTGGWARTALCYTDTVSAPRYEHPVQGVPPTGCQSRSVLGGDNRGTTASGDWDSGYAKAECGLNEYVAGVAQSPDNNFAGILCCPAAGTARTSCTPRVFASQDNRETTASGNWDAAGTKGECGTASFVAGVSRDANGDPHALLCCAE
ncbi:hypothetical protein POL68_36140 [Stigmatella sp. ncwal1]|uniref:Cellulase (Glycosyl hydrolase family 5) n=1 Tax=Stigmatella ashevillensis TaxID=2995309 RepID=A0ABT5DLE8_9BACT|nr:hypothetical protein [Stigmatella ashevillena]MDC0713953.1 hypothetical protein [Stigmatella ashevillena]